jgi:hypothetical protein
MMTFEQWWNDVQKLFQLLGFDTTMWDDKHFKEMYYDEGLTPYDAYETELTYFD